MQQEMFGTADTSATPQKITEFAKSLRPDELKDYLLSQQMPIKDCKVIKDCEIGGGVFLDISEDIWVSLGVSNIGLLYLKQIIKDIKKSQTIEAASPHNGSALQLQQQEVLGTAGTPAIPQTEVTEYAESLGPDELKKYLLSQQMPERDCKLIEDYEIGGGVFLDISEDIWLSLGVSNIGLLYLKRIIKNIKKCQTIDNANPGSAMQLQQQELFRTAGTPAIPQTEKTKFAESLEPDELKKYLLSRQMPEEDCKLIEDFEIGGGAFLDISEEIWQALGVSDAGLLHLKRITNNIKKCQLTETTIIYTQNLVLPEDFAGKVISDDHLDQIPRSYCGKWRMLCHYLELDKITVSDIERMNVSEEERRHKFFAVWKEKKGSDVTYQRLLEALLKIDSRDDAEAILKMISKS